MQPKTISIHAPRTGSDRNSTYTLPVTSYISIHAPRTGSDNITLLHNARQCDFNPRSPHGERPTASTALEKIGTYQSTLPARGATFEPGDTGQPKTDFNPRSPHGERLAEWKNHGYMVKFQSTLPARGATFMANESGVDLQNFNPRSPHGERQVIATAFTLAPTFQSTLPARGATTCRNAACDRLDISIHAPRTGSDTAQHPDSPRGGHFNPRSPHGERRAIEAADDLVEWAFQSTLPARGATSCGLSNNIQDAFQSTLPARGATSDGARRCRRCSGFQSTLPARGATDVQG